MMANDDDSNNNESNDDSSSNNNNNIWTESNRIYEMLAVDYQELIRISDEWLCDVYASKGKLLVRIIE